MNGWIFIVLLILELLILSIVGSALVTASRYDDEIDKEVGE